MNDFTKKQIMDPWVLILGCIGWIGTIIVQGISDSTETAIPQKLVLFVFAGIFLRVLWNTLEQYFPAIAQNVCILFEKQWSLMVGLLITALALIIWPFLSDSVWKLPVLSTICGIFLIFAIKLNPNNRRTRYR